MLATSLCQAYYDILPPTLSNMPIFWDAEELSLLTGSYLLEQVRSAERPPSVVAEATSPRAGTKR